MPVHFDACALSPLEPLTASAPAGFVIGVIGDCGSGKQTLLRLATGLLQPETGSVTMSGPLRYHGPFDPVSIEKAQTLALYHTLALKDAVKKHAAATGLELFRRRGGTGFLVSHDLDWIQQISDEIWWLDRGRLALKGDPRETVNAYRHHLAERLMREGSNTQIVLTPKMRRGDGRAFIQSIETLNEAGVLTAVWQTGALTQVRVAVRFESAVENPVIGILIRTRIGFEVYGTNTELEKVNLGPCEPGETVTVTFQFLCHLCPHEYTVTAASHDPDGVWHDWVEDGVAVAVTDHRYTAGVACLRASVRVESPKR
ncbi:MAG TPA: Wzt carbohydrate-binding domain-containing protein [Bryobacteraceae bacterium]|nr:Wzt carbohydrate-binding domain-containing protein [Bryobacteraceae bacterium]